MKRVLKISPLVVVTQILDENQSGSYQELLRRTLNGRATSILSYLIDAEDPLKILMLFKSIEWIQKLENMKIVTNINLNYIIKKTTDKLAVELLKQMYGKVATKIISEEGEGAAEEHAYAKQTPASSDKNSSAPHAQPPAVEVLRKEKKPAPEQQQPGSSIPTNSELQQQQQQQQQPPKPRNKSNQNFNSVLTSQLENVFLKQEVDPRVMWLRLSNQSLKRWILRSSSN
eukprot:CAMPEP_0114579470 /NCGR_PEP_ID=MMETSP0125-20121206/3825_1 /TAXON_ID=485358 ORGANISM="Aristerostoma sp., Strain ATCC 50986" /NCGR_SAMPLE_ID=MMETSP0125 /ASSEMBLY_ACC=CAM_ASM_000245 /LENGTH=228 /DNA_ID=CAMNT_0001770203 /DNA_START=605 /DNA_END=1292 /DNA_ORIENTATION=+